MLPELLGYNSESVLSNYYQKVRMSIFTWLLSIAFMDGVILIFFKVTTALHIETICTTLTNKKWRRD